jgi:NAD(P)H dehydrogenase (quinone)
MMANDQHDRYPILVTGAAGTTGGVGRMIAENLLAQGYAVRALVHREDARADGLRAAGAEVVVGDLIRGGDVARALDGCRRVYFAMSVSPQYLQATVTAAAAARQHGRLEIFVNMSQMTVSQMDLASTAESNQQRLQWLGEQVLNWSGLPVTHVRPTIFMENPLFQVLAARSIRQEDTIRLPFGEGRTSPVAARDVADVITAVLTTPERHVGQVYELTGSTSRDMNAIATEFSAALGRHIGYLNTPFDAWVDKDLRELGLPDHLANHLTTMARLHAQNRYDRATRDVETILGRPPSGIRELVAQAPEMFTSSHR